MEPAARRSSAARYSDVGTIPKSQIILSAVKDPARVRLDVLSAFHGFFAALRMTSVLKIHRLRAYS
jgi:hypothetical protein